MARRLWLGVMVVVPAFAKGQNGDPETVSGSVAGFVALRAPHMRGGIHQPGGMQADDGAQEDSPEEPGPAANRIKEDGDYHRRHHVPLADPEMKLVFAKVGDIGKELDSVLMHGPAGEDPAHVGPDAAISRRVWIALFVRILMMHAVGGDPGNRAAFYGQRAAGSQEILNEFRGFVAAMGKQAVIAHANAQAAGNPPHHQGKDQGLPGKEEKSA